MTHNIKHISGIIAVILLLMIFIPVAFASTGSIRIIFNEEGGTVMPSSGRYDLKSGIVQVERNEGVQILAVPKPGYYIMDFSVDGKSIGNFGQGQSSTWIQPNGKEMSVHVTFAALSSDDIPGPDAVRTQTPVVPTPKPTPIPIKEEWVKAYINQDDVIMLRDIYNSSSILVKFKKNAIVYVIGETNGYCKVVTDIYKGYVKKDALSLTFISADATPPPTPTPTPNTTPKVADIRDELISIRTSVTPPPSTTTSETETEAGLGSIKEAEETNTIYVVFFVILIGLFIIVVVIFVISKLLKAEQRREEEEED